MAKHRKKSVTMVDMSARLDMEIVPGTDEETIKLEKELDELSMRIQNISENYKKKLHMSIIDMLADNLDVNVQEESPSCFIGKYENILNKKK